MTAILDQADLMASRPDIVRPARVAETRELVIAGTPYIVRNPVRGEEVQILGVPHGARRWLQEFA